MVPHVRIWGGGTGRPGSLFQPGGRRATGSGSRGRGIRVVCERDAPPAGGTTSETTVMRTWVMKRWSAAWQRTKEFVGAFNATYDFVARLMKMLVVIVVLALLMWKWPLIDWRGTSSQLIAKNSPFQVRGAEPAPPTATEPGPPTQQVPAQPPPPQATAPEPTVHEKDYLNIYQFGQLVFTTDKPYEIKGRTIVFDKLLLKGRPEYDKPFLYVGVEIKVTHINEYVGLLVSGSAVEGPVLMGVHCDLVRR